MPPHACAPSPHVALCSSHHCTNLSGHRLWGVTSSVAWCRILGRPGSASKVPMGSIGRIQRDAPYVKEVHGAIQREELGHDVDRFSDALYFVPRPDQTLGHAARTAIAVGNTRPYSPAEHATGYRGPSQLNGSRLRLRWTFCSGCLP